MEEQKRLFNELMEEQKQTLIKQINDLKNEIKQLKQELQNAKRTGSSGPSN